MSFIEENVTKIFYYEEIIGFTGGVKIAYNKN